LLRHAFPHALQFAESVCLLVHTPLQTSGAFDGHTHEPLTQLVPPVHAVTFGQLVPQCVLSLARL
jgi:hypothetical protein